MTFLVVFDVIFRFVVVCDELTETKRVCECKMPVYVNLQLNLNFEVRNLNHAKPIYDDASCVCALSVYFLPISHTIVTTIISQRIQPLSFQFCNFQLCAF